jgi:beta-galactosidase
MIHFTRRSLLKTGLAASAGLIAADSFGVEKADGEVDDIQPAQTNFVDPISAPGSPRKKLLLDYGWRFHLGNADNWESDFKWGAPQREGTFAKSGQNWPHNPQDDTLQHSFDDSAWRVVDLPHDWAVDLPFVDVEGPNATIHATHGSKPLGREYPDTSIGWYERTFHIPAEDQGMRISLDFDGVFRNCIVLFNGFYLGTNFSGYAPFSFDVTDYILYGGKNVVTVRVDATLFEGWYYEGAGIYRHTWLTKTQPVHVAKWGTCVRSEVRGAGAAVTIGTEVLNDSDTNVKGRVHSRILDSSGNIIAMPKPLTFEIPAWGTQIVESQTGLAEAVLWSLEQPNLYRVVSQIECAGTITDVDEATFGIRTVTFDPNSGFSLNGKPTKIQGTCNHQDHAGVGIGVPDRIHFDRAALVLGTGSNAWRTAHSPAAPAFLDACDTLGLMVMSETRMFASTPEGLSQLERMIKRDRNHPSIIIWSLANEEYFYQGTATGARITSTMKRIAHDLDPTRLVTAAMNGHWVTGGISSVVDVQGFNYTNGDIGNLPAPPGPAHDIDAFHALHPKQPLLGSETADGNATRGIYKNDPANGWVNAYGVDHPDGTPAYEQWWTMYDKRPYLTGGFTWTGIDNRGESGPYDRVSIGSQYGIMDTCGFPKDHYYYYKSWWGTDPVLHLFPHWNWAGHEGQPVEVWCFSNLDSVELFLNGTSIGSQTVVRNSHLRWTVSYASGAIEARGMKNGNVVLTDKRETTGPAAALVLRPNRTTIAADGEDVSSIAVEVQDAQSRLVPLAMNKVAFSLSGPGRIIGVGNGDPSCREADRPDSVDSAVRSAFNGLAMVFVQSLKEAGPIEIQATADGLSSAMTVVLSSPAEIRPALD